MIDASFRPKGLLLNPRLPEARRFRAVSAWNSKLDEILSLAGSDSIGVLTSGSTGGLADGSVIESAANGVTESVVVLSQLALEVSAEAVNRHFHFTSSTRWALMLPTFHVGGYMILVRAAISGAEVLSFADEWNPRAAAHFLKEENISVVSFVPTQIFDLVTARSTAPSCLQTVIVGGGRLDPGLRQQAIELGWPVFESYGMTETCSQVAASENAQSARLKSLGHFKLKVDQDTSELLVSGPALFSGKLHFNQQGVQLIPTETDAHGFFRTSDRVQLFLENGETYLSFLGRTVDVVKILGENVDLAKVRSALEPLKSLSDVNSMEVVAVSNQRREHELVLVLETGKPDFDADSMQMILRKVQARLRESLMPVEVPTSVKALARFPRSDLGKVLYGKLLAELS